MLRLMRGACVIMSAAAVGLRQVKRRRAGQEQRKQLFSTLYWMEQELRCRSSDLAELLRQGARSSKGGSQCFLNTCFAEMNRLGECSFSEIWRKALDEAALELEANEWEEVALLGTVLGSYDLDTQCGALHCTAQLLETHWTEERAVTQKKNELTVTLSVAGGVLLVVLVC